MCISKTNKQRPFNAYSLDAFGFCIVSWNIRIYLELKVKLAPLHWEEIATVNENIFKKNSVSFTEGCPLTLCGSNSYCESINGSYFCQCESGFTSSDGGRTCSGNHVAHLIISIYIYINDGFILGWSNFHFLFLFLAKLCEKWCQIALSLIRHWHKLLVYMFPACPQ